MDDKNNRAAAVAAAAGGEVGATPVKERIFSLIKKLEEGGITDGRQWMWASFSGVPHVVLRRVEEGYVMLLWREGVAVRITLDEEFNVIGFDVEGP